VTKNSNSEKKYSIDELSESTGFSRRTIRFYIQEKILEPPAGRGRGGFYFDSHKAVLLKIKELQAKGFNLESINNIIKMHEKISEEPIIFNQEKFDRQIWVKYTVEDGIELSVRRDVEEKNIKKINEMINFFSFKQKGDK